MTTSRKTGIILILIGICLPTATMPFITHFNPLPGICLTSNFFGNLGNMVVVLGGSPGYAAEGTAATAGDMIAIPYRYLFAAGVVLVCAGIGTIVVSLKGPGTADRRS